MFSTDKLQPQTKHLIASVELMYKKPVSFLGVELKHYCGGISTVLEDGTPEVVINAMLPHQETTVVHELMHLVLRNEGMPLFLLANQLSAWADKSLFLQLAGEINEAVLHQVIFYRMQQLGFQPTLPMLTLFDLTSKEQDLDDFPEDGAIVLYMRVLLECEDQMLLSRYKDRYKRNGWAQLLVRGQELADYLQPSADFRKEQVAERFIGCLNLLFRDKLVFTSGEWTLGEKRGDHADHILKYTVQPSLAT
jgi:hypothetical protein